MNEKDKLIYEAKAKVFKALAHPTRLWMVQKLAEENRCVNEFVNEIQVDFSTISKHLSVLKEAGIVESNKNGKQVYYKLKVPCVLEFINCVESVIKSQINDKIGVFRNKS